MKPLPKIDLPLFTENLPTTGDPIQFHPFTVKEEKIFLIARESADIENIVSSIKQVLKNCIVTDIDVEKLAMVDIEYIMLKLRAKSVNNVITMKIEDPETKEDVELELDLNDIEVAFDENHKRKFGNDSVFVEMRYPSLNELLLLDNAKNREDALFDTLIQCIDRVYYEDETYDLNDYSRKEVMEFLDSLESDVIKGLRDFFDTMPKLRHTMKYTNSNGNEKTFVLEGIKTFFI